MTPRRFLTAAAIGTLMLGIAAGGLPNAVAPAGTLAELIPGKRPSFGPARVSTVPNEKAILRRFWVPELDAGYDPQGLAAVAGVLLVSAYKSEAYGVNRGACRLFRLDPESGLVFDDNPPADDRGLAQSEIEGQPGSCGHSADHASDLRAAGTGTDVPGKANLRASRGRHRLTALLLCGGAAGSAGGFLVFFSGG